MADLRETVKVCYKYQKPLHYTRDVHMFVFVLCIVSNPIHKIELIFIVLSLLRFSYISWRMSLNTVQLEEDIK